MTQPQDAGLVLVQSPDELRFIYTNWRGETGIRRIRVKDACFHFRGTKWHPEPQWLLSAIDLDKMEGRDFAVRDIRFAPPQPEPAREVSGSVRVGDGALREAVQPAYWIVSNADNGQMIIWTDDELRARRAHGQYAGSVFTPLYKQPPAAITDDDRLYAEEVELQEIADGAWGGGPAARGAARDRLATLSHPPAQDAPGAADLTEAAISAAPVHTDANKLQERLSGMLNMAVASEDSFNRLSPAGRRLIQEAEGFFASSREDRDDLNACWDALQAETKRADAAEARIAALASPQHPVGVREALAEALAVIDDYLAYRHDGDPWTEDARQHGEMEINRYQRDGRLAAARALLSRETA